MNISWEQFQAGYKNATPAIQHAIDSDVIPQITDTFLQKCPQTMLKQPDLTKLFSHLLLDTISEEELRNEIRIQDEAIESAIREINNIKTHQKQKAPQIPQAPTELKEKLELRPQGVTARPAPVSPQIQEGGTQPLTREEVLQALAPRRTMASDIESIKHDTQPQVGYGTENT